MDHSYYFDGNKKMISWIIENNETRTEQKRTHVENYYDQVSIEQSKYIALHVGIFWGVGRYIIKNGDTVKVMVDLNTMVENLMKNKKSSDPFVMSRTGFITQLIDQRGLNVQYILIEPEDNPASRLIA
jgi:hypothetical protein